MPHMQISEVARQAGIRASTIRYYEQIHILEAPARQSGQRRYEKSVLYRLALIQRAQQTGFTLHEIHTLFFGFAPGTPISARWRKLSEKKLGELRALVEQIKAMQHLLLQIRNCRCEAIEQCGKAMFERSCRENGRKHPERSTGRRGRLILKK
jgi:MerR family redox-sensitive transcriptional activator SoxR